MATPLPALRARSILAAVVLSAVFATTLAGHADARKYRRCPDGDLLFQCTTVEVPIDRGGSVPGTIPLLVKRTPPGLMEVFRLLLDSIVVELSKRNASRTLDARPAAPRWGRRGAVFVLAGGPGEAATPFAMDELFSLAGAIRKREIVLFDQRGTGRSGLLRCPSLEKQTIGDVGRAMNACAAAIGPKRRFFTTWDSAQDLEAVRQALGVEKITLYGVSYGTKLALTYAALYPEHVERMVLDSVVAGDGPDPFQRSGLEAIPRILHDICARDACARITQDPVADLGTLVGRLQPRPITGRVVGGNGRRHARQLGRLRLLDVLYAGDFDETMRNALPGAVRAALRDDTAPLLRLYYEAAGVDELPEPRQFSTALFFATTCEEGPLPWSPELAFADRWKQSLTAAAAIPDSEFGPFDRQTAAAGSGLRFCARWPSSGVPRALLTPPLPNVPTLLLSGANDMRTPAEDAARVAAMLARASQLTIDGVGHSVLLSDPSFCADGAMKRFFANKPISGCGSAARREQRREKRQTLLDPVPPLSLNEVKPAAGVPGRGGRLLRATEFSVIDGLSRYPIEDAFLADFTGERFVSRIGGLRSGRMLIRFTRHGGLEFDRYAYVPGIEVSGGTPRRGNSADLRFRVRDKGRLAGRLVFDSRHERIRGRLGGRRFNLRAAEFARAVKSFFRGVRLRQDGTAVASLVAGNPVALAAERLPPSSNP
ncbi:MAG: alpha/beta fold hydrolase [Solirubrobacterales bacterium]